MNKKFLLVLFMISLPALMLGSGKIRGKVVDSKTKEALIGASVVIVGTNFGAVTDVDGNYIILNLEANTYSVRASYLGYQNVTMNNVKVNDDLSTETNFSLTSSEVELKEVVIQVERPLVNKNATNAVRIGTQDDIEKLPVRGVTAAIVLSPGVVQQNGALYIRGGRSDEVGYYLEGASTRSITGGGNLTTVIPEALEEFQVQAGGYPAEFGGANAGIVRQSLRSGGSEYRVSAQVETDNFTKMYERRFGTYSYGYSDYVLTVGGPVPGFSNIRFFVAGENTFQRDNNVKFWDGFTMHNLPDRQSSTGEILPVYEIKPGNIPGMRNRYTTNGTVTFDFNPFIVRLGGSFSYQKSQNTGDIIANVFNTERLPLGLSSNLLLNLKFTHILNTTTNYDLNVSYMDNRSKNVDPRLGDNFFLYSDSIANAKLGYQYRSYISGPLAYDFYGFGVSRYGTLATTFSKNKQTRVGGSIDITSQIDNVHQLKVGASIESYHVANFSTGSGSLLNWYRNNPDNARTPGLKRDYAVGRNGGVNNYGYDWYGNEITDANDPDGPKTPQYIAAYIQDKIEYSDLVVNAGVRLDYINNDDFEFVDDPTTPTVVEGPHNPSVDASVDASYPVYKSSGLKSSKPYVGVSPRLGFSFPVSDRTVFHLQYGKFIQAPNLNTIYRGRGSQAVIFSGGNAIFNPVGYNVQPERTTQYEVGFTQQFTDNAAFDITGFYKDISGQIQIKRMVTVPGALAAGYNTYVNGDFVTSKGLEMSLRLRRTNRITAQVNYTFSDAQGTGSTSNSSVSSVEQGTLYPTVISPLDFNYTHKGAVNFDYSFGKDDGGPILEQLGLNLLFTFNSGHPFTLTTGSIGQQGASTGALVESDPRFSNPLEGINGSTTPWQYNFNLRLYKGVDIAGFQTEFYIYVQNLLNTRTVINVYRRTGNASDDGFLSNPDLSSEIVAASGPGYVELYENANLKNGRHYSNTTGNDLWGTPRQIRFGVKVEM